MVDTRAHLLGWIAWTTLVVGVCQPVAASPEMAIERATARAVAAKAAGHGAEAEVVPIGEALIGMMRPGCRLHLGPAFADQEAELTPDHQEQLDACVGLMQRRLDLQLEHFAHCPGGAIPVLNARGCQVAVSLYLREASLARSLDDLPETTSHFRLSEQLCAPKVLCP